MLNRLFDNIIRYFRLGSTEDPLKDERVRQMKEEIQRLEGINFSIEISPNGEWVAESTNIEGIITGGDNYPHNVGEQVRDAIFTYYEVPSRFCDDALLRQDGEVSHVERRVYA